MESRNNSQVHFVDFRLTLRARWLLALFMLYCILIPQSSSGNYDSCNFGFDGNLQVWAKYEWTENGKLDQSTQIPGAQNSVGFLINDLQAGIAGRIGKSPFFCRISTKFDKQLVPLDCYAGFYISRALLISIGQMKIPSNAEAAKSSSKLDFISAAQITSKLLDWSLTRTPYISNLQNNKSYGRDIGLSIKGSLKDIFMWHAMIGNGFGANRFLGGYEKQENGDFFANTAGNLFFGFRLVLKPFSILQIGAAANRNKHKSSIFNDIRYGVIQEFDRTSFSADAILHLPYYFKLEFLTGFGTVGDNYANGIRIPGPSLTYNGYAASVIWGIIADILDIDFRIDNYRQKFNTEPFEYDDLQLTGGITFRYKDTLKLMLNYIYKDYSTQYRRGISDDLLALQIQFTFNSSSFSLMRGDN